MACPNRNMTYRRDSQLTTDFLHAWEKTAATAHRGGRPSMRHTTQWAQKDERKRAEGSIDNQLAHTKLRTGRAKCYE